MIEYKHIKRLDIETSSLCNAECPSCSRRASGGIKNKIFKETYITLKQVKEWFSEDFIKQLGLLTMCGNYGDSMTNPELIPILKYFRSVNPNIRLRMNTNASGRDQEFWQELGKLFKGNGELIFSVDGLEDTNWIYRKGTHWDKIMVAMKSFISTGASAHWEFLVFRHNEHQVEEARQLSLELGFDMFYANKAMGFHAVTDKNGDEKHDMRVYGRYGEYQYTIKPPLNQYENVNRQQDGRNLGECIQNQELTDKDTTGYLKDITEDLSNSIIPLEPIEWGIYSAPYSEIPDSSKWRELTPHEERLGKCDINCQAIESTHIFVNSYGLVFPCCYHASQYDDEFAGGDMVLPLRKFIHSFGDNAISLEHHTMKEIIDSEIYTTGYMETFENRDIREKRLKSCSIFCGKETNTIVKETLESIQVEKSLI